MILPSAYDGPRFTTSQHASPCAVVSGFGLYIHFTVAPGLERSNAYRRFGYGVTTYMVLPTTSGAASCPRCTPVAKVHAGFSDATLLALISFSPLKRELAKSLAGRV